MTDHINVIVHGLFFMRAGAALAQASLVFTQFGDFNLELKRDTNAVIIGREKGSLCCRSASTPMTTTPCRTTRKCRSRLGAKAKLQAQSRLGISIRQADRGFLSARSSLR